MFCGSGGVGQDVGRGRGRARRARPGSAARCSCSRSTRRAGSRPRSASTASATTRTASPPEVLKAAGLEPRGELWAAMLDTKQSWDDLVLRHAPGRGDRVPHPREPAVPQPHRALRAESRLHRDGAAVRDPRERRVRPHRRSTRRRRGTRSTSSTRRRAWPSSSAVGLLRWLTLPYRVGGKRGTRVLNVASRPFYQMADRILGEQVPPGHRRVLPQLPVDVRRLRRARAQAVERLLHDRRTTFAVVTTLEAAPLHEAERFCAGARRPRLPPRCARPQQDAARLPARPRRRRGGRARSSTTRGAARRRARRRSAIPRSPIPSRTARVLRTIGESYRNFSVVAMREAELRAELARVPDVVVRVPTLRGRHQRRRGARRDRAATSSPTT